MATALWQRILFVNLRRKSSATLPRTSAVKRGEIWSVEFDPAAGSKIRKKQPALIVSNNAANRNLARVVVAPLTSNIERQYPSKVIVTVNDQSSKAIADQLMVADTSRLKKQIGTIDKTDMPSKMLFESTWDHPSKKA